MDTANILLNLAGDRGNTVPKFAVTAAEIAVLRAIHGEDAVTEIEVVGSVERTHRTERNRLAELYGRKVEGKSSAGVVDELFPGAAARVFETVAELEIPETFFKAERRVSAQRPAPQPAPEQIAPPAESDEGSGDDGDGIDDIKDEHTKPDEENGGPEPQNGGSDDGQQNSGSLFG